MTNKVNDAMLKLWEWMVDDGFTCIAFSWAYLNHINCSYTYAGICLVFGVAGVLARLKSRARVTVEIERTGRCGHHIIVNPGADV